MEWSQTERNLVTRYFDTTWTKLTLYNRIQQINPKRSFEAVTREIRRQKEAGQTKTKETALAKLRVGYLDIEATNLNGDFGFMLTWYIKPKGSKKYDYSIITKKEIFDYDFDKRLVEELLEAFNNYDVLYTHWGVDRRFDIPFIRTRALVHGLHDKLPGRFEKFIMDTWPIARNKLRLHSNRLDSIADACRIRGVKKTPLSGETWSLAAVGHPESLEYIATHNRHDVILLEKIHKKLECMENKIYRSI